MTAGILIALSFVSAVLFPWPVTGLLAVAASLFEPLIAFAAGIVMDALYYSAHAARLPWFTMAGALISVLAVFVRDRLKTSTIWG